MTANTTPSKQQGCAATPEELCAGALKHYDELSTKACSWMNQIPQAIRFWYLEKPKLERDLAAITKLNRIHVKDLDALAEELERVKGEREKLTYDWMALSKAAGWSVERCEQEDDSPFDCIEQLKQRATTAEAELHKVLERNSRESTLK